MAAFALVLPGLVACVDLSTPSFSNPLDKAAPSIAFAVAPGQGTLVTTWNLSPDQQSPLLAGSPLKVYRQISLKACDPNDTVVATCGAPVLVGPVPPNNLLAGPMSDKGLSVPWGPRQVSYFLKLVDSNQQEHLLAQATYSGTDDLDHDGVAEGDCDDANPQVGRCDPNATCTMSSGTWSCVCNDRFTGDGATCSRDCSVDNGGCDPNADCTGTPGTTGCTCHATFLGDGLNCACPSGKTLCNGACVDTRSDPGSCGTCGTVCGAPHGTPTCVNGSCAVASCDDGFADCNGIASDGCEVDLSADPQHCSSCSHDCMLQHALPACNAGVCGVSMCASGFGDCDNTPSNGCETNVETTAAHCGTCANACSIPNGSPACRNGSCAVEACQGTFADCDGLASNGCETDLSSNTQHCGTCGNACTTGQSCVSGACR
jgi:hypothetical protein